jgi:hypothetical protein
MLSSEIDLLMYSTFAVQSNKDAWQQCFAFVLPYVLLWSNRVVIHLANDDSRTDPRRRVGRQEGPARERKEASRGNVSAQVRTR